jgi:hypothetical protein
MRIAVLVSGQPRFIEDGARWFKNRVFPAHYRNLKVDYYCYFWDDGSPDLESRIVNAYNPVKYQIVDYNPVIDNFLFLINDYNSKNTQHVEHIYNELLYDTHHNDTKSWNRHFWGQYLATNGITNLVGDLTGKYDIVIKTRSDAVFNPLLEEEWIYCFNRMYTHYYNDIMFTPWMQILNGVPNMSDFAFISKPDLFYQFSKNIYTNCIDLATKDKALFYELTVADHTHIAHWLWNKISNYSRSNWVSFINLRQTRFSISLLRESQDIQNVTYTFLEQAEQNYYVMNCDHVNWSWALCKSDAPLNTWSQSLELK